MQYQEIWNKILSEGEKVEYEFSIGKTYRLFHFFIGLLIGTILDIPIWFYDFRLALGLIAFLVLLLWFFYGFYLKVANAYAFTNKRVVVHRGWLSTHAISVDYEDITDTSVEESFFDRILTSSGHLIVNTAGTHTHEVVLRNIEHPYEVKKKLEEARDKSALNPKSQAPQPKADPPLAENPK